MQNQDRELEIMEKNENLRKKERNTGYWAKQQQEKYIQFISNARKELQASSLRKYDDFYYRNNKVFKKMSEFVGTRDGIQCRSHHIKQLRTHKQINGIIQHHQLGSFPRLQEKNKQNFLENRIQFDKKNTSDQQVIETEKFFYNYNGIVSTNSQQSQFYTLNGPNNQQGGQQLFQNYGFVIIFPTNILLSGTQ